MRRPLTVVGLLGAWLIMVPPVVHSRTPQAGQVGCASWYGKEHHGRKTASGERFSRWQLTAAHPSLPMGTKVKVTHLRTTRHVIVKINDRGPYGKGKRCIIDLSEAAARQLELVEQGTARVQVVIAEGAAGNSRSKR
jgi:rare lipoprotein A